MCEYLIIIFQSFPFLVSRTGGASYYDHGFAQWLSPMRSTCLDSEKKLYQTCMMIEGAAQ